MMTADHRTTHRPGSIFTPTWWTQVWRWCLVAVLALGIAVATLVPRGEEATLDQLIDDLRAGEVTELQLGPDSDFGGPFIGPWQHRGDDMRVRWRVGEGRWQTFLTKDQQAADSGRGQPDGASYEFYGGRDPVLDAIADELAWLHPDATPPAPYFGSWQPLGIQLGGMVVLLGFLAVAGTLISGPQPRLATKWAWFWLLWALPFGIGFLAIILVEAPWSRRASAQSAPLPHHEQRRTVAGDRRLTGVWAFVIAFVTSAVV